MVEGRVANDKLDLVGVGSEELLEKTGEGRAGLAGRIGELDDVDFGVGVAADGRMLPDKCGGILLRHEAEVCGSPASVQRSCEQEHRYQRDCRDSEYDLTIHRWFLRMTMVNNAVRVAIASNDSKGMERKPKNSMYFSVHDTP